MDIDTRGADTARQGIGGGPARQSRSARRPRLPAPDAMAHPMACLDRFRRADDGGALVEFALVLPLLLTLLFGIVGWGLSLSMHNAMYDTARSCARSLAVGAIGPDDIAEAPACAIGGWVAEFDVAGRVEGGNAVVTVATPNPLALALPFVPMPADLTADVFLPMEAGAAGPGG